MTVQSLRRFSVLFRAILIPLKSAMLRVLCSRYIIGWDAIHNLFIIYDWTSGERGFKYVIHSHYWNLPLPKVYFVDKCEASFTSPYRVQNYFTLLVMSCPSCMAFPVYHWPRFPIIHWFIRPVFPPFLPTLITPNDWHGRWMCHMKGEECSLTSIWSEGGFWNKTNEHLVLNIHRSNHLYVSFIYNTWIP